ncbi:MAG: LysR substrate-binding domain-containing protein [Actinomycetota bacterium]
MDVSLRQLRMLREVAARGTIAAAAEALSYTPSALSQQLGALERSTGVPVLERVGRNVRLTDAGRELVGHVGEIFDRLERAEVALLSTATEVKGRLTLGVFESIIGPIVAPLLAEATRRHPELDLWTREVDPDQALDDLASGELDLAFILDYPHAPGARPEGIDRTTLHVDHFHVVVARDDELGPGPVRLEELRDRDFVRSPAGMNCGRCVTQACRDAGFEARVRHEVDDYPATLQLVAAGVGIALLPSMGLMNPPPGVKVLALAEPVERTIEAAHRSASAGRPALEATLELARHQVERWRNGLVDLAG